MCVHAHISIIIIKEKEAKNLKGSKGEAGERGEKGERKWGWGSYVIIF